MKTKTSKRLLGVLLAAALIVTQIFVAIPASADSPVLKLTQTFESATGIGQAWETGIVGAADTTYGTLSIAENVDGHTKALRVQKSSGTGGTFAPRIAVGNATGTGLGNVTEGQSYNVIISFDYKVAACNDATWGPKMQKFYFGRDAIPYSSDNLTGSADRSIVFLNGSTSANTPGNYGSFKTISDNTWRTTSFAGSIQARQGVTNGNTRFGFAFEIGASVSCDLYLDNISVQIVSAGATYSLYANNGTNMDLFAGIVGETAELPIPSAPAGSVFAGWYTDSGLTTPFGSTYAANTTDWTSDGVTRTNAITHLYAKYTKLYDEMVQNFDSAESIGGEWGSQTVITTDATYLSLQTEAGRGNVLNINCNRSSSSGDYSTGIRIGRDAGETSLGEVLADSTYNLIVTFDYKVTTATGGWGPYISKNYIYYTPYQYWSKSSNSYPVAFDHKTSAEEPEEHYSSYSAICDGEWHTMSFKTTGTAIEYSANGAYVFVLNVPGYCSLNASFDNFRVKKLASGIEASTVVLHSNGGTEYDIFTGIVGQPLTLPDDIECEDHDFRGWYTDSDLLSAVGENAVYTSNTTSWGTKNNAVTEYYAKWYVDDGYKSLNETFEEAVTADLDYRFTADITQVSGATATIEEETGNKYFKYTNNNTTTFQTSFIIYDEDDVDGYSLNQYVRSGSSYNVLISYKYKIDHTYGDGMWLQPIFIDMDNASTISTITGGKFIKLGTTNGFANDAAVGVNDGTWRTASSVVTLRANYSTFTGFGFYLTAPGRVTVSLDDISVTVLEPGEVYSNIAVDTTGTPFALDNVAGEYGDTIGLTLPSNMYKKGYKFNGFKDQNGVAYSNTRTFAASDLTFAPSFVYNKVYDYNSDNSINILDLVKLKLLLANDTDYTATVTDNTADMITEMIDALIRIDSTVTVGGNSYTLAWAEEFKGNSLNSSSWTKKADAGDMSYDSTNQRVIIQRDLGSLVNVENGSLKLGYSRTSADTTVNVYRNGSYEYFFDPDDTTGLTLVKANAPVYYASAGGIISNMKYKYGYMETRVKLPGNNFGAAFWLNNNASRILHNEVDLFETLNSMNAKTNIHTWDPTNWNNGSEINYHRDWHSQGIVGDERAAVTGYDSSTWYTLGFEWTSTYVKFYVDGVNYLTVTAADLEGTDYENDFDGFVNEALKINIDGKLYNNNTSESSKYYYVDYIRIYQNSSASNVIDFS